MKKLIISTLLFVTIFIDGKILGIDIYLLCTPFLALLSAPYYQLIYKAIRSSWYYFPFVVAMAIAELANKGGIVEFSTLLGYMVRYTDMVLIMVVLRKYFEEESLDKLFAHMISFLILIGFSGYFLYFLFDWNTSLIATEHRDYAIPSIRSTTHEPNIFGQVCLFGVFFLRQRFAKRILFFLGLMLSFTRAVLLLYLLGKFYLLIIQKSLQTFRKSYLSFFTITSGVLVFCLLLFFGYQSLIEGFSGVFSNSSASGRFYALFIGFSGFIESPLIGNGLLSADTLITNQFGNEHHLLESPGWLGVGVAQILHDGGLALFLSLLYFLYRVYKNIHIAEQKVGFVFLSISIFFATYSMTEAFVYGFFALILAKKL